MICKDCDYVGRPTYDYPCSRCDMTAGSQFCMYEHKEKPTNADKIRTMSDEELVGLIRAFIRTEDCPMPGDPDCDECLFKQLCIHSCKYSGRELEWLKQPAEE